MKLLYLAIYSTCFLRSVESFISQNDVMRSSGRVIIPGGGGVHKLLRATKHDDNDNSNNDPITKEDTCDVAIFGGGFGGLYTALAISRQQGPRKKPLDIVLVDPGDKFVFLPLLYDLTVGTASEAEVCPFYKDLLKGTGVRHVRGSFESLNGDDDDSSSSSELLSPAKIDTTSNTKGKEDAASSSSSGSGRSLSLSFRASVVAVGATPESILASVPGASELAQPFYTQQDARATQRLLTKLESEVYVGNTPRVAIVGGGYGGVELAACVKRRIPKAAVSLLTRGPPMKGTRAEPLVDKALRKLGVQVEVCSVEALERSASASDVRNKDQIVIRRQPITGEEDSSQGDNNNDEPWDAVLWTAGSGPAYPVSNNKLTGLERVEETGHLVTDETLRCYFEAEESDGSTQTKKRPPVWALGDCAEIIGNNNSNNAVPRTAQAAMQQADTVAHNVACQLNKAGGDNNPRRFVYQDLGTMVTLGGPNAALFAPSDDSSLGPVFAPLLDVSRGVLGVAETVLQRTITGNPVAQKIITPDLIDTLGLSLSGYGLLGVDADASNKLSGTLAGTLTGAARRAIYAVRMPTTGQRAVAATSAAIYGAVALAKEAEESRRK